MLATSNVTNFFKHGYELFSSSGFGKHIQNIEDLYIVGSQHLR
jgi:hypothetical protein